MYFLLVSLLLSSSFLGAIQNDAELYEEELPFLIEKKEYDELANKVCQKAFKECPNLESDSNNYKCRYEYYYTPAGTIVEIEIIHKEDIHTKPVCAYQYDYRTKKLKRNDEL